MLNIDYPPKRFRSNLLVRLGTVTLVVLLASEIRADQFIRHQNGREVVVHTNPLPVFLHRLIPPNYGRHITLAEYRTTVRASNNPASRNPQSEVDKKPSSTQRP